MKTFLAETAIAPETLWRKATRSGAAGHCVEVAGVDGGVALRHSKDPGRGAFLFTPDEMSAFVHGAKAGEFDDLLNG